MSFPMVPVGAMGQAVQGMQPRPVRPSPYGPQQWAQTAQANPQMGAWAQQRMQGMAPVGQGGAVNPMLQALMANQMYQQRAAAQQQAAQQQMAARMGIGAGGPITAGGQQLAGALGGLMGGAPIQPQSGNASWQMGMPPGGMPPAGNGRRRRWRRQQRGQLQPTGFAPQTGGQGFAPQMSTGLQGLGGLANAMTGGY